MPNPIKGPKTTKNQPQPFRESLAMPMPSARATVTAPSHSQARVVLWVIWALATIALGIGAGRLIRDLNTAADTTEPGLPVAQAAVQQPVAATQRTIAQPAGSTQPTLTVKTAQSVNQAQAGSPAAVLATAVFQPASDPDSLQPGFQTEVRIQGQIGTQRIR